MLAELRAELESATNLAGIRGNHDDIVACARLDGQIDLLQQLVDEPTPWLGLLILAPVIAANLRQIGRTILDVQEKIRRG